MFFLIYGNVHEGKEEIINPHCSPLPFNMLSIVGFKNFGWRFVYYRFLFAEGFVIDV